MEPLTAQIATPDTTLTSYHIPLSAINKWPPPNLLDPEHRTWIIPFAIVLELLTTASLIGRIWARINRYAGGLGVDDGLVVFAWLFGTLYTVSIVYAVDVTGFGKHIWDQDSKVTALGGLLAIFAQVTFLISTAATKVSILLFYRRLIDRTINKILLWGIYAGIAFAIVYMLSILIFLAAYCSPTSASWKSLNLSYNQNFSCADRAVLDPLSGILSAAGDIYAIIIPEIVVAQLKLPQRRKLVLYGIFGAGAVVVAAALVRTGYFIRFHTDELRDLTWTAYDVFVWTTVELQFALIYACIPALKSVVSSRSSQKGSTNRSYIVARSFSKQKSVAEDEIQLTRPKTRDSALSAHFSYDPEHDDQTSRGKDKIVITRTVEVTRSNSKRGIEEPKMRTTVVGQGLIIGDKS